jgi:hypothetical protein
MQKSITRKLVTLEQKYDGQVKVVFDAIRHLMAQEPPQPRAIGVRRRGGPCATIRFREVRPRRL